jgi:hypothetical protein
MKVENEAALHAAGIVPQRPRGPIGRSGHG